jgi:hypothetical protein
MMSAVEACRGLTSDRLSAMKILSVQLSHEA